MQSSLTKFAAAMALIAVVQAAQAAQPPSIQFTGTSSTGEAVMGQLFIDGSVAPSIEETLLDGTKHNRFVLAHPIGDFDGGWMVNGIFSEDVSVSHPFPFQSGPGVDTYLTTDGRSSLRLDWVATQPCHGGCRSEAELHLSLNSATGSLFGSSLNINNNVLSGYDLGSGSVKYTSWFMETQDHAAYVDTKEMHYTLSAVPEPQAGLLLGIGLGMMGLVMNRRKHRHPV